MEFPIYRKYKNSETYFKINNEKSFEEISFIGSKLFSYDIKATQYPEFLRIKDMIACKDDIWIEILESDFNKQKNSI